MVTKRNNLEITRLAKVLAEIVRIFRKGKAARDFRWWQNMSNLFKPYFGYQDAEPLLDKVVQGVIKFNPEMLSEYGVKHKLVYDFLQNQTIDWTQIEHLRNHSLIEASKEIIEKLIEFEAWQEIDIPIAYLQLEGEPVKFIKVTFMKLTEDQKKRWAEEAKVVKFSEIPEVNVFARVNSPGDEQRSLTYAREQVDLALDVMRAFSFPFGYRSHTWQVGVVGDVISATSTPMRINDRRFITFIGGYRIIEIKNDILSKLEKRNWQLINRLMLKTTCTAMENKLRNGIHWLAESTKPDTNNSKFAKISFALETLIGGEPEDEDLKVRGITAMLAERTAFITGSDFEDCIAIDRDIRKFYGMRGNIVHGGKGDVSLEDIDEFGQLVRRLAVALLVKLDKLKETIGEIEKLEKWIRRQKYSIPNNSVINYKK